jgi:GTP-binding protein LepA
MSKSEELRNFCIIAHVDHGKSTLADRFLEFTNSVNFNKRRDQMLDSMDLERERGLTVKLSPVQMRYSARDGREYVLNLIDTPGHVDFSYEVSRSLAACEGALLVVDASQGVQARTVANAYMAASQGLEIIPVINKIDLPHARAEEVKREIEDIIGIDARDAILASAKEGIGIEEILERIVKQIPPPGGSVDAPLQALIFDSIYDNYRGVVCYVRLFNGTLKVGQAIKFMATERIYQVEEVGTFHPHLVPVDELGPGDVGYVIANVKSLVEARVGDTITDALRPAETPLPGYAKIKPVVFCGFYPLDSDDYGKLRESLEKLQLNDASLTFEPETSAALGFGFRCGFLGLLHMDITKERLSREFSVELVATAPNVVYQIVLSDETVLEVHRPSDFPESGKIKEIREPYIRLTVFVNSDCVGRVMQLCQNRRGQFVIMSYITQNRVRLIYDLPLAEFIGDFYDRLNSATHGFASLDYEHVGFRADDLVKVDILIHGEQVDAFSFICHRNAAYHRALAVVQRLKELIPRQLFEVAIQATVGRKVIVRQTVRPLRKDVLAKCYGGDVTRKRKLLEKQKEGKKRMKQVGHVMIPQEAFLAFLQMEEK